MKKLHQTLRAIAVPTLALLLPFMAQAIPVTVDVTGAKAWDKTGDSRNTVLLINVGANAKITGFSFDVNVTGLDKSFRLDLELIASDSAFSQFANLVPAPIDGPGTGSYTGAQLVDFMVGSDGILRLEFIDTLVDNGGTALEGIWNFGTITFDVEPFAANTVPEPGSLALAALALGAVGASGTARRRQVR